MKKSRFLALAMCYAFLAGMPTKAMKDSSALAVEKFLNNDLNINNRFKKQKPRSSAEQFRENTEIDPVVVCLLLGQSIRELIGYGNGYKTSIDKANIGYAVKKICEYNSKEARKESLMKKTDLIFNKKLGKEGEVKKTDLIFNKKLGKEGEVKKTDLIFNKKLGKGGEVGKLLRAKMRDQDFVDFFNSVIEKNTDYNLATPKILSEGVVDEMLSVTTMTDEEKEFVKDNVDFYLCPVRAYDGGLSFDIYGFLKEYKFLEVYTSNPGVIQNYYGDPSHNFPNRNRNMFVHVRFSDGQLMNGDDFTKQYGYKPLNILKKVNDKFVLADT